MHLDNIDKNTNWIIYRVNSLSIKLTFTIINVNDPTNTVVIINILCKENKLEMIIEMKKMSTRFLSF